MLFYCTLLSESGFTGFTGFKDLQDKIKTIHSYFGFNPENPVNPENPDSDKKIRFKVPQQPTISEHHAGFRSTSPTLALYFQAHLSLFFSQ
jgi:hypothetical protein